MGVFDNKGWSEAREKTIADSVRLCTITDIHTTKGKARDDGKPPRDVTYITLALAEDAVDTDGDPLPVGFVKDIGFGFYDQTQGEQSLETTNRITNQRIFELVVHALGLPTNCKDPKGELDKMGGPDALRGKQVLAQFKSRQGNQNVQEFLSPSARTPAAK